METKRFLALICCRLLVCPAAATDLLGVYTLALQNDPRLREADDVRLAARQAMPRAVAALLPQLTASGSANRETDRGAQNQVETVQDASGGPSFVESFPFNGQIATNRRQFGVDLRQSLFRWENWVALRQANAQVAGAEADYLVAQQDLIARVVQDYFDLLADQDLVAAQEAALTSVSRQLFEAQRRYDAGLIAIAEVTQAQAAHDNVADAVIAAKRTLAASIEALREITGTTFAVLARPIETLEPAGPEPAEEDRWVSLALTQNPALISSRLAADAARERVRAAYGGHLPSIDMVASRYKATSDGIYTNANGQPFGSVTLDQYQNRIGIQFTIPLFSGGLASAQIREAIYQHRASNERVQRVTRQVERDTRDAYLGVVLEVSRIKSSRRAVESGTAALRAAEISYGAGTRGAVDVLESRRQWLQAQMNYSRSRYNYMVDLLRLEQAAGSLSADSVRRLNGVLTEAPPQGP